MGKARRKDKDAVQPAQDEPKLYLEPAVLECSVPESRLKDALVLPEGIDYNEWLASHTIAFFDHTNLVYGTISEFCSMSGCPDMSGPNGRQYLWYDEKGKKCKVAAPQYIDCVMTFTQRTLQDESIFPTKYNREFPGSFESIVKKIARLLFHVLAHIYHMHFKEVVLLNMHAHLNSLFAHFTLFNVRFGLVEDKEVDALTDLAAALRLIHVEGSSEVKPEDAPADEPATPVIGNDKATSGHKPDDDGDKLDITKVPQSSSPSIAPSISMALHSRSSSGSSGSCAMDYTSGTQQSAPTFGSSPLKFQ